MKLCECGCGEPAPIARTTDMRFGWVKGEPTRYIHNHHPRGKKRPDMSANRRGANNPNYGRKGALHPTWKGGRTRDAQGYIRVLAPTHPNTMVSGYILEHRLVASAMLGRPLRDGEVVHHIDRNRANNDPSNLIVFASRAEHQAHHARLDRERVAA